MRISRTKLRQLVLEEIQLLNEITFASAVNNLGSKKNKKMIRRWIEGGRAPYLTSISPGEPLYKPHQELQPLGSGLPGDRYLSRRERWDSFPPEIQDGLLDKYVAHYKNWLLDIVPDDLEDNQKGLVVTWLNRLARDPDTGYLNRFLSGDTPGADAWGDFEMFFHYQQFMAEKDLNRIADLSELEQIVLDARDDIKAYQKKRAYADAGEGTEVLRDDDKFYIAAIHNKGAACSLGKGTDWCTAAPGLDYFSEYYRPEDPLFYFEDRDPSVAYPRNRPPEDLETGDSPRFQFHYGSLQFMTEDDQPVSEYMHKILHDALMQTEAPHKYPIIKKYDRKMKIERDDTSPEDLHELVLDDATHYEELVDIAKHRNISDESLRKMMTVGDPQTPDYVGRTGGNRYATGLKQSVARGTNSPELLEDLWVLIKSDVARALEETEKRLRASSHAAEDPEWLNNKLPLQLRATRGSFVRVWKQIVFNPHVSNELMKEIAEFDGGAYLDSFVKEKILSREEGLVGDKVLTPLQIRSRAVRRLRDEAEDEDAWEAVQRAHQQSSVDHANSPTHDFFGRGSSVSESKIYARWKKIIN